MAGDRRRRGCYPRDMPVQIGVRPHSAADPMGLMSDCHRRIEMFLAALERAGQALERPADGTLRDGLAAALRYFREAAPKHNADEEASLFPRLRATGSAEAAEALALLERLEREHRWADSLHATVDALGEKYLAHGPLPAAEAARFRAAVAELRAMYGEHIGLEDQVVFPLAVRLLSPEAKAEVTREMAARRTA